MRRLLNNELRRAFTSRGFAFVLGFEVIILIIYSFFELGHIAASVVPSYLEYAKAGKVNIVPGAYYSWLGMFNSLTHKLLKAVIPILIAIPYGNTLYIDKETNYISNVCIHIEKGKYYLVKIIVMFISGGVVAVLPYTLSFLIDIAVLPLETVIPSNFSALSNVSLMSDLYYEHTLLYVFAYLILTFIGFGFLNCLCFIATYLFSNKYIVVIFPFFADYFIYVIGTFINGKEVPWDYLNICNASKQDIHPAMLQFGVLIILIGGLYAYLSSKKVDIL